MTAAEESETDGEEVCSDQASDAEGGSDDSGGDTTDDALEGPDFTPADHEPVLPDCPAGSLAGMRIYHRWDVGWFEGSVLRQVQMSSTAANNGKWAVKYADSRAEKYHALLPGDYGPDQHWLVIKSQVCGKLRAPGLARRRRRFWGGLNSRCRTQCSERQ